MAKHFIAMAGMRGCTPNCCDVFTSFEDAVDYICFIHEIGPHSKFRKKLKENWYTDLHLHDWQNTNKNGVPVGPTYPGHGNEYAEIVECECEEPWIHSDSITEEEWDET